MNILCFPPIGVYSVIIPGFDAYPCSVANFQLGLSLHKSKFVRLIKSDNLSEYN